jgi:thioredoxin 1
MIDRRFLLTGAAALGLLPLAGPARATIDYTPGLVDARLAAGETVLVDFWASWCSTCRAQSRVMDELRAANPAYDAAIAFIRVDWDLYATGDLSTRLSIPRRSTLVMLRGDRELGRIVAGTREAEIRALLDLGLA